MQKKKVLNSVPNILSTVYYYTHHILEWYICMHMTYISLYDNLYIGLQRTLQDKNNNSFNRYFLKQLNVRSIC